MESNPNSKVATRKSLLRRLWSWQGALFVLACIITLIALIHAEENWRGGRAWQKYKRQLEASGESFDEAKLIPPQIPDDQNFAAIPFLKPLYDFLPGTQIRPTTNAMAQIEEFGNLPNGAERRAKELSDALKDPARKTEQRELAVAVLNDLTNKTAVIEQLRTASRERPLCRFNVAYDYPDKVGILLPHLALIRNAVRMVVARANAELALGKTDAAFDDCMLAIYLAESVRDEPFLISTLVQCASLNYAMQPIKVGIANHAWSAAQLQQLQEALAKVDLIDCLRLTLRGEAVVFANNFFEHAKANRAHLMAIQNMAANGEADRPGWVSKLLLNVVIPRGWIDLEQANYHRLFHEMIMDAVDPHSRVVMPAISKKASAEISRLVKDWPRSAIHHTTFSLLLIPSELSACEKPAFAQDEVNMTVIACALERYRLAHGSYPVDLTALAPDFAAQLPQDSIKGQTFRYKATGDSFKLYSVGWNETDDGGTIVKGKGSTASQLQTQGDWVWSATP